MVKKYRLKYIFFIIVIVIALWAAFQHSRVTIPLLIAYLLSHIIRPILYPLYKIKMSKVLATSVVFLGAGIFILYPVIRGAPLLIEEATKLQVYLPQVEDAIKKRYVSFKSSVEKKIGITISETYMDSAVQYGRNGIKNLLMNTTTFFTTFFEWLLLVPLFMFFIIIDGGQFRNGIMKLVPNQIYERVYFLLHKFNRQIGDYIFAKAVEASIVGIMITVGLFFIGFPFALLIGIIAGITNVIPYLGPIIGAIPVFIIALIDPAASGTFGAALILVLVANILDLALIFPILVSKIVDLHPVLVVISVIIGSHYLGMLGMIISIPVAAILKLVFVEIRNDLYYRS